MDQKPPDRFQIQKYKVKIPRASVRFDASFLAEIGNASGFDLGMHSKIFSPFNKPLLLTAGNSGTGDRDNQTSTHSSDRLLFQDVAPVMSGALPEQWSPQRENYLEDIINRFTTPRRGIFATTNPTYSTGSICTNPFAYSENEDIDHVNFNLPKPIDSSTPIVPKTIKGPIQIVLHSHGWRPKTARPSQVISHQMGTPFFLRPIKRSETAIREILACPSSTSSGSASKKTRAVLSEQHERLLEAAPDSAVEERLPSAGRAQTAAQPSTSNQTSSDQSASEEVLFRAFARVEIAMPRPQAPWNLPTHQTFVHWSFRHRMCYDWSLEVSRHEPSSARVRTIIEDKPIELTPSQRRQYMDALRFNERGSVVYPLSTRLSQYLLLPQEPSQELESPVVALGNHPHPHKDQQDAELNVLHGENFIIDSTLVGEEEEYPKDGHIDEDTQTKGEELCAGSSETSGKSSDSEYSYRTTSSVRPWWEIESDEEAFIMAPLRVTMKPWEDHISKNEDGTSNPMDWIMLWNGFFKKSAFTNNIPDNTHLSGVYSSDSFTSTDTYSSWTSSNQSTEAYGHGIFWRHALDGHVELLGRSVDGESSQTRSRRWKKKQLRRAAAEMAADTDGSAQMVWKVGSVLPSPFRANLDPDSTYGRVMNVIHNGPVRKLRAKRYEKYGHLSRVFMTDEELQREDSLQAGNCSSLLNNNNNTMNSEKPPIDRTPTDESPTIDKEKRPTAQESLLAILERARVPYQPKTGQKTDGKPKTHGMEQSKQGMSSQQPQTRPEKACDMLRRLLGMQPNQNLPTEQSVKVDQKIEPVKEVPKMESVKELRIIPKMEPVKYYDPPLKSSTKVTILRLGSGNPTSLLDLGSMPNPYARSKPPVKLKSSGETASVQNTNPFPEASKGNDDERVLVDLVIVPNTNVLPDTHAGHPAKLGLAFRPSFAHCRKIEEEIIIFKKFAREMHRQVRFGQRAKQRWEVKNIHHDNTVAPYLMLDVWPEFMIALIRHYTGIMPMLDLLDELFVQVLNVYSCQIMSTLLDLGMKGEPEYFITSTGRRIDNPRRTVGPEDMELCERMLTLEEVQKSLRRNYYESTADIGHPGANARRRAQKAERQAREEAEAKAAALSGNPRDPNANDGQIDGYDADSEKIQKYKLFRLPEVTYERIPFGTSGASIAIPQTSTTLGNQPTSVYTAPALQQRVAQPVNRGLEGVYAQWNLPQAQHSDPRVLYAHAGQLPLNNGSAGCPTWQHGNTNIAQPNLMPPSSFANHLGVGTVMPQIHISPANFTYGFNGGFAQVATPIIHSPRVEQNATANIFTPAPVVPPVNAIAAHDIAFRTAVHPQVNANAQSILAQMPVGLHTFNHGNTLLVPGQVSGTQDPLSRRPLGSLNGSVNSLRGVNRPSNVGAQPQKRDNADGKKQQDAGAQDKRENDNKAQKASTAPVSPTPVKAAAKTQGAANDKLNAIEKFFKRNGSEGFAYNKTQRLETELYRLNREQRFSPTKWKKLRTEFCRILADEFDANFGDSQSLENWVTFCVEIGASPIDIGKMLTMGDCIEFIKRSYVSIFDLLNARLFKQSVRRFQTREQLNEYVFRGRQFPLKAAKPGGPMACLLQQLGRA